MELGSEQCGSTRPEFGDALRRALANAGKDNSREDAVQLARALLNLSEKGLLVAVERGKEPSE